MGVSEMDETLFQDLMGVVQRETFGNKVTSALNQRKQGHFDKAMLTMSEVNRDQVLSIRATQSIIDKTNGVSKTEVVFEKYRQFYPFQIGLKNGKDILALLDLVKTECNFTLETFVADLHENESMIDPLLEELNFFETRMKGRISEDDISQLERSIKETTQRIFEIKTALVDVICGVVQAAYFQIPIVDKISLIKNIYLILSSSIQTLDAQFVEVENRGAGSGL